MHAMHSEDLLTLNELHAILKAAQSARVAAILWLLGGAASFYFISISFHLLK